MLDEMRRWADVIDLVDVVVVEVVDDVVDDVVVDVVDVLDEGDLRQKYQNIFLTNNSIDLLKMLIND